MTVTKTMATAADVKRWKQPGSAGFFAFLEDVRPMIPSERGGFEPYELDELVRAELVRALDGGYSTIVFCWPRRHGKTVLIALIIVWRFLTRETQEVAIVANSERQTVDTAFRLVKSILERTPYTARVIGSGSIRIGADSIAYPTLGNLIQGFASNVKALFGKKLSIAQVSELHAARTADVYDALASSTIDTDDGLVLVDSTTGPQSSPLHALYQLHKNGGDPSLFFSHIEYRDLEDAIARGPRWIRAHRLRSRAAQMLPAKFEMEHLNRWGSASNALFPADVIERCKESYPLDPKALAGERGYAVGAGLDRALRFSLHGDRTVLACVLKTVGDADDEPHFYVLDAESMLVATEGGIKRQIAAYRKTFGLRHIVVERYEASDIQLWAAGQGLESELAHATPKQQATAFLALSGAASEGRLHIHPKFKALLAEMATFEYELVSSGTSDGMTPRFGHAKGAHDDHVYAVAWAIHSLREVELNPYEVAGIHCHAPGHVARLCLLNGGELVPQCAEDCSSFQYIYKLYDKYRSRSGITSMVLVEFFRTKVINIGSHTFRR